MTLHSAFEDLQETTLRAVTSCLRGLEYISGLRDEQGGYGHWGLAHVHGDLAAKRALVQAHRSVLSNVLSTPIRELVEDAEHSSGLVGLTPESYVQQLSATGLDLLPPEPGAGSARHLSSVLHALSSLLKNPRPGANPPA